MVVFAFVGTVVCLAFDFTPCQISVFNQLLQNKPVIYPLDIKGKFSGTVELIEPPNRTLCIVTYRRTTNHFTGRGFVRDNFFIFRHYNAP